MARQAATSMSARRVMPRTIASMRSRVLESSTSASSSSRLARRFASSRIGVCRRCSVAVQRQRRGQHRLVDRARVDLLAVAHHVVGGARQHLVAQRVQEHLHRAVRPPVLQALQPAVAGQGAGRFRDVAHQVHGAGIVEDQVLDPAPQAACARGTAAAFAAEQPAAQIGRLLPGQVRGEGAVDRLEQVMALVEHVAGRQALILGAQARPGSSPARGWRSRCRPCARGAPSAR